MYIFAISTNLIIFTFPLLIFKTIPSQKNDCSIDDTNRRITKLSYPLVDILEWPPLISLTLLPHPLPLFYAR